MRAVVVVVVVVNGCDDAAHTKQKPQAYTQGTDTNNFIHSSIHKWPHIRLHVDATGRPLLKMILCVNGIVKRVCVFMQNNEHASLCEWLLSACFRLTFIIGLFNRIRPFWWHNHIKQSSQFIWQCAHRTRVRAQFLAVSGKRAHAFANKLPIIKQHLCAKNINKRRRWRLYVSLHSHMTISRLNLAMSEWLSVECALLRRIQIFRGENIKSLTQHCSPAHVRSIYHNHPS